MTDTDGSSKRSADYVKLFPNIEDSIGSTAPEDYRTVTCRYYTKLYSLDSDREKSEDILVLNHSNKICLITLAPTHPVLANKLKINKVNFEVSKKVDRKSNKTSGKSKKGGQALEPTSVLAFVETDSGTFPVMFEMLAAGQALYEEIAEHRAAQAGRPRVWKKAAKNN